MKTLNKLIRALIAAVPGLILILAYQNCGNEMSFDAIHQASLEEQEGLIDIDIINTAGYEWGAGSAAGADAVLPDGYNQEDFYTLWEVDGEYSIIPTHTYEEYGQSWLPLFFYPTAAGPIHIKVVVKRISDNSVFAEKTKTFNVLGDPDCIFCDGFED